MLVDIKRYYSSLDKNLKDANLNKDQEAIVTPHIVIRKIPVREPTVMESSNSRQPEFPSDQKILVVETWHHVENHFNEVL